MISNKLVFTVLYGDKGNDLLLATDGNDVIDAGDGNDVVLAAWVQTSCKAARVIFIIAMFLIRCYSVPLIKFHFINKITEQ